MEPLDSKKIAFLIFDNFEEADYVQLSEAFEELGANTEVISPNDGPLQGLNHLEYGASCVVNRTLSQARAKDYAALVVPGGVANIDELRRDSKAHDFMRAFEDAGKPIAMIGHAPWLAVTAGTVDGVKMTSYPSLSCDIVNAGGEWVDRDVVRDGVYITARDSNATDALSEALVEVLTEDPA